MICTCGADGQRAAETRRRETYALLGLTRPEDLARAVEDSIRDDFKAVEVDGAADQWFGAYATTADGRHLSYECDHLLDGLIAIWHDLRAENPAAVAGRERALDPELLALSERQLDAYAAAATAFDDHKGGCAACQGYPWCDRGRVLFDASCYANVMRQKWGPSPLEERVVERDWGAP